MSEFNEALTVLLSPISIDDKFYSLIVIRRIVKNVE